jgi:hypothetical protein
LLELNRSCSYSLNFNTLCYVLLLFSILEHVMVHLLLFSMFEHVTLHHDDRIQAGTSGLTAASETENVKRY